MVDNGADTSTVVCNLPSNLNEAITPVEKDKMKKEQSNHALIPLTRSKTLDPEEYGHLYRGSDNYNHIHFNSLKHLSSLNDNKCNGNKQLKEEILDNKH